MIRNLGNGFYSIMKNEILGFRTLDQTPGTYEGDVLTRLNHAQLHPEAKGERVGVSVSAISDIIEAEARRYAPRTLKPPSDVIERAMRRISARTGLPFSPLAHEIALGKPSYEIVNVVANLALEESVELIAHEGDNIVLPNVMYGLPVIRLSGETVLQ